MSALVPERCREIPEARDPSRVVLRQFAVVLRHVYIQQFASSEDERYMHNHQWAWTIAVGLSGSYEEHRIAGPFHLRKAPYFFAMDASTVHHVQRPSGGHTSLLIGLWRDDTLKHYYGTPADNTCDAQTTRVPWPRHIKRFVKQI